jgi:HPt (histidine-containing phosphotransfer) domain-containing protein
MNVSEGSARPLHSQLLADDPGMRDIVEEFVDNLAVRLDHLQTAHEKQEWDRLQTLAHQLKGAGGSYGYPEISRLGATMEASFKKQEARQFAAWMDELASLIAGAKAGLRND